MSHEASSFTSLGWTSEEVIEALVLLAQRNDWSGSGSRAATDAPEAVGDLAELIGAHFHALLAQRDAQQRALDAAVVHFSEVLLALASRDFSKRAHRTFEGDPLDVLAYLINSTADELGAAFAEREREARKTDTILEGMNDGVLVLDERGAIQRVNHVIAELLGRAPSSLIGSPIESILSPASQLEPVNGGRTPRGDAALPEDLTFRTACGDDLELVVRLSLLHDESGAPVGCVMLTRDERERRKTEARLRLGERLAAVGRAAAGVAHEINNPLASVLANLEFLRDQVKLASRGPVAPEELLEAVEDALEGIGRVRNTIRDLRSFARPEYEPGTLVDVNELLEAAANLLGSDIRQGARLVRHLGEVPAVDAHGGRVVQIFVALLQNAVQAMPQRTAEDSEIRLVSFTDANGNAVVEVCDNGCGIAGRDLPHVFEPFFTTRNNGAGMGLSIAHNLITSMGGSLTLESEAGGPTVARVVLPPSSADRSEITGASPAVTSSPAWSPTQPSPTS